MKIVFPVLSLRAPYDFARSIGFWQRSTGELCEQWADGVYRRVIALEGAPALLMLRSVGAVDSPAVAVELNGAPATPDELNLLEPIVRQLLGDDLDLHSFYAAVAGEPVFAGVTQQLYGVKAPRSPLWETLCWVIIGQQISLPFAYMLKQRLVERYGERFEAGGRALDQFPSPERLADAEASDLLAMQFSRNKASFITGLARQLVDGSFDLDSVSRLSTDAAISYLIGFRGIGRWTAEFTLMRALGRPDAFPANDAGVRQGVTALYGHKLAEPELRAFAGRWGGWSGIAAIYLLAWLREMKTKHHG